MIEPSYMINGLVQRGMPEHIARAFAAEAKSEAGLDPGVNETNPVVPGSRGGFGLMQWTGPRRRALEAFATQRGVPVADPDMQMDFLMTELQGPERAAWESISQAPDTVSAARAITDRFLRPGVPRYDTRRKNAEELAGLPITPGAQRPASSAAPQPQDPRRDPRQDGDYQRAPAPAPMPDPLAMYAATAGLNGNGQMQLPSTPRLGLAPDAFQMPLRGIQGQYDQLLNTIKGGGKNVR